MAGRDPQFGVEKSADELLSTDPASISYGVTPNNKYIPLRIDTLGRLELAAGVTLSMSDIQIGAVEIKNADSDDRVHVSPAGELRVESRAYDGSGNALTSTVVGPKRGLDVYLAGGITTDIDDDSVSAGQTAPLEISLLYGYDGIDWQRIKSAAGRLIVDGSQVTQPISGSVNVTNATLAVTQSGAWSVTANIGTTNGLALDSTLSAIKSQTDLLSFTGNNLNVQLVGGSLTLSHTTDSVLVYGNDGTNDQKLKTNVSGELQVGITNATLAVTQSGIWTTGRTWTLASGTDSVSVIQSGTWNLNNISGTISLPTGASTETTLLAVKTDLDKFTFSSTRLLVDGSGVIQPVSQSGTWTVTQGPGNALTPWQVNAAQSGNWSVRLQDGAGTNLTSSLVNSRQALDIHQADTSFIVSGLTAIGNAPSLNPVSVSGVDGGGLKRHLLTDTSGKLQIGIPGFSSILNSSTTPLGSNGVFVGTFEDVTGYAEIVLTVISDVASATNGLVFQWSSDGVNVDRSESSTVSAGSGRAFAITVRGKYFRIVYTNGSSAQLSFRLHTDYHTTGSGLITKPIADSVTDQNFASLVQATHLGRSGSNYLPIDVTTVLGLNYLDVAEIQNVRLAPNNQSTSNLLAGATFTGTADSTLGVNAIRVNIIADQPLAVLVQQSIDGVNWDVQDRYTLAAGIGDGRVIQAVASYVRILATNIGASTTTYFRLQTTLCPESDPEPRMPMENLQSTISASGGTITLNNNGYANVGVQITGTWVGTLQFEVESDSVFTNISAIAVPGGLTQTSTTANGIWVIPSAGFSQIRVRASAWTSGTATVTLIGNETASTTNSIVTGPIPNGSIGNPNPVVVGGRDDTGAVQSISTDDLIAGSQFLYVTSVPIEADACNDGDFYSSILEFTLPSNGTETPFLLIKNPTASTVKMWIDEMQMDVITKGQQAICRLYADPTITVNGTSAPIVNTHIIAGAPASVTQAFSGPTATANGSKLRVFSVGTNSNSLAVPFNFGLIVEPNHSILITGTPTANNVVVAFSVRWVEAI